MFSAPTRSMAIVMPFPGVSFHTFYFHFRQEMEILSQWPRTLSKSRWNEMRRWQNSAVNIIVHPNYECVCVCVRVAPVTHRLIYSNANSCRRQSNQISHISIFIINSEIVRQRGIHHLIFIFARRLLIRAQHSTHTHIHSSRMSRQNLFHSKLFALINGSQTKTVVHGVGENIVDHAAWRIYCLLWTNRIIIHGKRFEVIVLHHQRQSTKSEINEYKQNERVQIWLL